MNGGPNTWTEYAREEWERMGIHLGRDTDPVCMDDYMAGYRQAKSDAAAMAAGSHTAADPLTVDWQIAADLSDHGGAPAMLGLVMLSLAFAAGVFVGALVGWLVPR